MKRLFLLLATVGLLATACQKSEQNGTNGDGGAGGKKLVKIVCSSEGGALSGNVPTAHG